MVYSKGYTFAEGTSSRSLQWRFMNFCHHWNPKALQCCAESSIHLLPVCQNRSLPLQAHSSPQKAGVWQLSPLTACPPTCLQTSCSWGLHKAVLGGRPPLAPGSLLWQAGTSASTLLFVYLFLANEPLSSQKKAIQSDSKDESYSKPGRDQWGNVWTGGLQPS